MMTKKTGGRVAAEFETTPLGDPCGPDSEVFYDFGETAHDLRQHNHQLPQAAHIGKRHDQDHRRRLRDDPPAHHPVGMLAVELTAFDETADAHGQDDDRHKANVTPQIKDRIVHNGAALSLKPRFSRPRRKRRM